MKNLLAITKIINGYGRPGSLSALNVSAEAGLNETYLKSEAWNEQLVDRIKMLKVYIPEFNYAILNSKIDKNLYYHNLMLSTNSKPIVGDVILNQDNLPMHTMSLLLNEATTIQFENLRLSGLSFTIKGDNEISFGKDLNELFKEYLLVCKMGFDKQPGVIYNEESKVKILPFIKDLFTSIEYTINGSLTEYFVTANGPSLCLELAKLFSEEDFVALFDKIKLINKYNKLYRQGRLSETDYEMVYNLYCEIETILIHAFHQEEVKKLKKS